MAFLSLNNKRLLSLNLKILLPSLLLSVIGVVTLLSTTIEPTGGFGNLEIVYKQILFIIIGLILYLILSKIEISYIKHWQILLVIYLLTLLLLVATLLFGPTINFVKRWLVLGGFQIQASEIAKVTVILFTAAIMSKRDSINEWVLFLITFLLTLPFIVLIYIQPDASMTFLTLLIWFLVAFLGLSNPARNVVILLTASSTVLAILLSTITANPLWLLILILPLLLAVFSLYSKAEWKTLLLLAIAVSLLVGFASSVLWQKGFRQYQRDRIEAFFNPLEGQDSIGFNVNQARIAIGSGRFIGKGFGNGTQSKRNFLPEHQTDFIFASYAEEFGLVGGLFLISIYGWIIISILTIAMNSNENRLFSLITVGVATKILLEVFINVGTNTGAIPATGIPLPLVSAGGSITIMTLFCLGLIDNISRNGSDTMKKGDGKIVEVFEE